MILALKTDQPLAELILYSQTGNLRAALSWQAHRELSNTLFWQLEQLLSQADRKLTDINQIIFFSGPGSFTGLRIGASFVNALAPQLKVQLVGLDQAAWSRVVTAESCDIQALLKLPATTMVVPEYGQLPRITQPRK